MRRIGIRQLIGLPFGAFVLGAESILVWMGLNEERDFDDLFLRNGLVCIAMLMMMVGAVLSTDKVE